MRSIDAIVATEPIAGRLVLEVAAVVDGSKQVWMRLGSEVATNPESKSPSAKLMHVRI